MIKPSAKSAEAAARIAHDLGLAACFGGALFGKVVFNFSLPAIGSKTERGRLGAAFWNRSNLINAAAFGVAVATWLPDRIGLSGGEVDPRSRSLVSAKDALMGAAASAGLAAVVAQISLNRRAPEGVVPLESGGTPAPEAGARGRGHDGPDPARRRCPRGRQRRALRWPDRGDGCRLKGVG